MKFMAAHDPDATPAVVLARRLASRTQGGRMRGVSIAKPLTQAERMAGRYDVVDEQRPRTRGECANGPRPCPWAGCRYHLFLDVQGRSIKFNFPDVSSPVDLEETCALDVADREMGATLEQVGDLMNITRERLRQLEEAALIKIRRRHPWEVAA